MNTIDRVDFNRSNLYGVGQSNFAFRLVALMSIDVENRVQTFGLSQAVMAGNMFVEKELLKRPPLFVPGCRVN